MAGAINAIDITQRMFEIVSGSPFDDSARIRAEFSKIAEAEQPALPSSTAQIAGGSTLPAPIESLPLNASTSALSAEALSARLGIGRSFDLTIGVIATSPSAQNSPPLAIAPVEARLSAEPTLTPTVAPEIAQTFVAPPLVSARQTAVLLDNGPDAQARRSEQLAGLAGLAANNPVTPLPFINALSPLDAPIVIYSLGGSAAVRARGLGAQLDRTA